MDTSTFEKLGFVNYKTLVLTHSKNNQTFVFDTPIKNVVSVEVSSALIPRGEYTVEQHRNLLRLKQNNEYHDIIIQSRDYSSEQMISELTILLSTFNITPFIETGKGKFSFTSDSYFELDMKNSTCQKLLGFNIQKYKALEIDSIYTIIASNKYNLMGTDTLYLKSNIDSSINSGSGFDVPLSVFYLYDTNSQYWQTIHDIRERQFHPIGKLDRMTLSFVDPYDNQYNFNGMEFSIQINIKFIDFGINWSTIGNTKANEEVLQLLDHMIKTAITSAENIKPIVENFETNETKSPKKFNKIIPVGLFSILSLYLYKRNKFKQLPL